MTIKKAIVETIPRHIPFSLFLAKIIKKLANTNNPIDTNETISRSIESLFQNQFLSANRLKVVILFYLKSGTHSSIFSYK
jgi:hypothetical protein